MNIERRLRSLERQRDDCAECGGGGLGQLLMEIRGTDRPAPVPRGCPRCGRVGQVTTIVITCPEKEAEDAAMLAEWSSPEKR